MKYDLIALDLDGTALNPKNLVEPSTAEAVRDAQARGMRVVVSTGRICGEAAEFARAMGADDYMVTSGGAALSMISEERCFMRLLRVVVSTGRICGEAAEFARAMGADDYMVTSGGAALSMISEERCFMRLSMPWEASVRAAAALERIGLSTMVYVAENLLITPYDELAFARYKSNEGYLSIKKVVPSVAEWIANGHVMADKIFSRSLDRANITTVRQVLSGIEGYLSIKKVVPSVAEWIANGHVMADKIFSRSLDRANITTVRQVLSGIEGIRVMSSADDNVEVVSPAANKATALSMLCQLYGTDLAHTAAVGDSENDLEMLHAAALPIAMGNANAEVKALCSMLCQLYGTDLAHTAAVGDSENDLEMLHAAALPIAMGNANAEVKALCRHVTDDNAHDGVAKAIEWVLRQE